MYSLLNTIDKKFMRTSAKNYGHGGGGEDPNKNFDWNKVFKEKYGESANESQLEKIIELQRAMQEMQAELGNIKNIKNNASIDKISSALDEILKNYDINVEKLRNLAKDYNAMSEQIQNTDAKIDLSIINLRMEVNKQNDELQAQFNMLNNNFNDYITNNNNNIHNLEIAFKKEIEEQRSNILNNVNELTQSNTSLINNTIDNRIDNLRRSIDDIVLNSINNGLSRLINFVLTFGGLFNTKIFGSIILFICMLSIAMIWFNNSSSSKSVNINILQPQPVVNEPSIEQPMQQIIISEPVQIQNTDIRPPELSLIRSALIKALQLINEWLDKKIKKISK